MSRSDKATRLHLWSFSTPQMRAFHMSWFAFFLCFFAWFGIAPLMVVVRQQLQLTREQVGWCMIGSVAITVFARLLIGWLCDRVGPRLVYTGLLLIGSLPVMGITLAHDFSSFLIARVLIGAIGASFVITQCHTSLMFAENCVGMANATAAGWGNLGGGVTQWVMPLVFAFFVSVLGVTGATSWRLAMFLVGVACALMGVAYYFLTQDTPAGNVLELRRAGRWDAGNKRGDSFFAVCQDRRVWALFAIYGACFGIELTIDNIAVLYFLDYFPELETLEPVRALQCAGVLAGLFGGMNLFARALGGIFADRWGQVGGFAGRVKWLFIVLFCEGCMLMLFSQTRTLSLAIPALLGLALFTKMSSGATYAVVPFINKRALGSVSGIVGAGGNAGAVAAGFLFKAQGLDWPTALLLLGICVTACSFLSFAVTLRPVGEGEGAQPRGSAPLPATSRPLNLAADALLAHTDH